MKKQIKNILLNYSYLPIFRSITSLKIRAANMASVSSTTSSTLNDPESIRAKFENYTYDLIKLPLLLSMDREGVFVNKEAPNQDIVNFYENLEQNRQVEDYIKSQKLIANGSSDWGFGARKLPMIYFRSREALEEMLISKQYRTTDKYCIQAARMPIREIMRLFFVSCSSNMDYYLANKNELEADLGRSLQTDSSNKLEMKRLEQELFYVNMCKIFGTAGNQDDNVQPDGKEVLYDKTYMLKDFSILSFDGNEIHGTAIRGDCYFVFFNSF